MGAGASVVTLAAILPPIEFESGFIGVVSASVAIVAGNYGADYLRACCPALATTSPPNPADVLQQMAAPGAGASSSNGADALSKV